MAKRKNFRAKQEVVENKEEYVNGKPRKDETFRRTYRENPDKGDLNVKGRNYKSSRNDSSWYAKNEELLKAAANFPFGYPIGTSLPKVQVKTPNSLKADQTIPGICVLPYVPTIGRSDSGSSAVNLAAKLSYSNIRYANSGTTYGDPSDLMMYYLAIDSMYMFHQYMVRAYGVLRTYNYMNRYYPQAIVEAMGLDFDDLNAKITQFWGYINTYAVKLQSFAVPSDISYFVRHAWMTSGIYLDGNASKAQTYMYVPIMYYMWNETTEGPNQLDAVSPFFSSNGTNFPTVSNSQVLLSTVGKLQLSDLMQFGESLMTPVLQSESFGLTTGAILKSYGGMNLMKVGQIPENYQVIPAYNAEVLSQIENATLFSGVDMYTSLTSFNVTQNTGVDDMFITATPRLYSYTYQFANGAFSTFKWLPFITSVNNPRNVLINMHIENPTPADFMVATRLTATCNQAIVRPDTTGSVYQMYAELSQFGSEIIVNPFIVAYQIDLTGATTPKTGFRNWAYAIHNLANMDNAINNPSSEYHSETINTDRMVNALIQQFDWHPDVCIISINSADAKVITRGSAAGLDYYWSYTTRDIENFAIVTDDNLQLLNECAMLSLFDSPRVAELVSKPYKR